jgi:hypothetical protein
MGCRNIPLLYEPQSGNRVYNGVVNKVVGNMVDENVKEIIDPLENLIKTSFAVYVIIAFIAVIFLVFIIKKLYSMR